MTIYLLEIAVYGLLLFLVAVFLEKRNLKETKKRAEAPATGLHITAISESEADWIADFLKEALQQRKTRTPSTR